MWPGRGGALAVFCYVAIDAAYTHNESGEGGNATADEHDEHDECSQEGHGHGWHACAEEYEIKHFEEVTVVTLVGMTLLVEVVEKTLHHLAEHSSVTGLSNEDRAAHDLEKKSVESLWLDFFNHVTAEFTVLGILACLLWLCHHWLGVFEAALDFTEQAEDFAFPHSVEDYVHATETAHMHLFVTFMLYFMIVGFSLAGAQQNMAGLAVSAKAFHEETARKPTRKAIFRSYVQEDWSLEFNVMRQTFLSALQAWSGKWAFFDATLGKAIQQYAPLEDQGIVKFLGAWFPFGHYLRLNLRSLLDHVVSIHPASLMFMIVVNGILAAIHRLKIDLDLSTARLAVFGSVITLLWCMTTWVVCRLKSGTYDQGRLVDMHMSLLHHPSLPKYLLVMLQCLLLYICFELTKPLADSRIWELHYARSVVYMVICFCVMPLFGWLVWGRLLSRIALSLSCGFMISEKNVHRIQTMVEVHMENSKRGEGVKEKEELPAQADKHHL